ncbi:MAG: RsmE family RNA methyltransferase [candidate division KSB1 bacterium]|nr:RsmE family RNA methyltransferase [candidate division KSB1 bacterium]
MHFEQFYVDPGNISENTFILVDEEARHAARVMRKHIGDPLSAADGRGRVVSGPILNITQDQVIAKREETHLNPGEPALFLTLAQGVPKGSHFDWVVEKGTEIGVSCFQPLLTERCIADPSSRLQRWRKKAFASMKQSGRSRCPNILPPCSLETFFDHNQDDINYIAHETSASEISPAMEPDAPKRCALLIGPEGGFTLQEYSLALEKHAIPLSLGPRRLRSETAAMVGIIQILYANGELQGG